MASIHAGLGPARGVPAGRARRRGPLTEGDAPMADGEAMGPAAAARAPDGLSVRVLPMAEGGVDALAEELAGTASRASFCAVHLEAGLDPSPVLERAAALGIPAMGATSSRGVMTGSGPGPGMVFALEDAPGEYGCALRPFPAGADDASVEAAARAATQAAMAQAGRPGEAPELVWLCGTPGREERLLAGIESVVGTQTPIVGGSAADNDVAGGWSVFAGTQRAASGVAVGVLYPSCAVSTAYQNGYAPAGPAGRVTAAEGRTIFRIDDRPAAEVYAEWTGGAVAAPSAGEPDRPILAESAFWPLGREIADVAGVTYHLLVHPALSRADGGIDLFAEMAVGERLVQMCGSVDGLTARAGRVAALAARAGQIATEDIAGALVVYCGGCMMSVADRLDDVVDGLHAAVPGAPFAGVFTFGEQGPILGAGNRHGNLMISCIVFSRR